MTAFSNIPNDAARSAYNTATASSPTADASFPACCLVGSVGDFAKVMASGSEVPAEFYFAAGLTLLGHICGTKIQLDNALDVRPQLYTVLLGDSGEVKKSTAMRKTIEFFERLDLNAAGSLVRPQISYGVGSAEGLAKNLSTSADLLMGYDELRSFIDKCGVQSSVLLPMVTSLFEQTNYQNTTKASNVAISGAHLSLLGCCTTETYADMWTPAAIAIGLPNRLLVVKASAQPRVAWPEARDQRLIGSLLDRFTNQLRRLPLTLAITSEALTAWESWYLSRPQSIHATRLDTIGFRLMGLIALATDKEQIDGEVVSVVTEILNYEYRVRVLTDPINADNKIAALEQKIRNVLSVSPGEWVPERILRQRTHGDRAGLFFFSSALKNLTTISQEVQDTTRGRKSLYRLTLEPEVVSTSVASMPDGANRYMIQ